MYRVRTVFTGVAGTPWYSNLHFVASGGTPQQARDAVETYWTAVDNVIANTVLWSVQNEVPQIDPLTGNITDVHETTGAGGVGGSTVAMLPSAAQILVRFKTGIWLLGRQVQGKCFVPAPTTTAATAGRVTSTTKTTVLAAANALVASPNANLAVYSPTKQVRYPVLTASVWDEFAVMRSRRD